MMTGFVLKKVGLVMSTGKIIAVFDEGATARFSTGSTICVDMVAMVRLLMILTVLWELTGTGFRLATFGSMDTIERARHIMNGTQRTCVVCLIGVQMAAGERAFEDACDVVFCAQFLEGIIDCQAATPFSKAHKLALRARELVMFGTQRTRGVFSIGVQRAAFVRA
jgi:hypothetical protein